MSDDHGGRWSAEEMADADEAPEGDDADCTGDVTADDEGMAGVELPDADDPFGDLPDPLAGEGDDGA